MILRLLAVAGVMIPAVTWAGEAGPVSLTWNELGPRIAGKKIALVLPGGTYVQGKVRGVDSAGIRLKISKTSAKTVQPKGEHTIARDRVSLLRVTEYRKIGRLAFTSGALAAAGAFLARGARDSSITEGPLVVVVPVVAAAGTVGLGFGAYYLGKAVDKRVTDIRVEPER